MWSCLHLCVIGLYLYVVFWGSLILFPLSATSAPQQMATASMASFSILYSHKIPPHCGTQRTSSVLHEIRLSGLGAKPRPFTQSTGNKTRETSLWCCCLICLAADIFKCTYAVGLLTTWTPFSVLPVNCSPRTTHTTLSLSPSERILHTLTLAPLRLRNEIGYTTLTTPWIY